MSDKLEELKKEATDLGIDFHPNIGATKLEAKIEEFYKSHETSNSALQESIKEKDSKESRLDEQGLPRDPKMRMRILALKMEKEARETRIVTIVDNDQRENNLTTTVSVTCGNQYFELGTKRLPLNIPVEVEQGFLEVLKEIKIPMHIKDSKGLGKTVLRNRYSINYENIDKVE